MYRTRYSYCTVLTVLFSVLYTYSTVHPLFDKRKENLVCRKKPAGWKTKSKKEKTTAVLYSNTCLGASGTSKKLRGFLLFEPQSALVNNDHSHARNED